MAATVVVVAVMLSPQRAYNTLLMQVLRLKSQHCKLVLLNNCGVPVHGLLLTGGGRAVDTTAPSGMFGLCC